MSRWHRSGNAILAELRDLPEYERQVLAVEAIEKQMHECLTEAAALERGLAELARAWPSCGARRGR